MTHEVGRTYWPRVQKMSCPVCPGKLTPVFVIHTTLTSSSWNEP